ncbi:MAG TPA: protealysin inhibitor emfourin [Thermoanaerobaculia bacterium]|nr:protealysin inhibitor emfourin [Thermoanaerobaculia bacterium]
MVRIRFSRSGGFAGLQGPGQKLEVDSKELPAEKGRELERLVAAARLFDQPEKPAVAAVPDGFQYDLAIEDGGRRHSLRVSEGSIPPGLPPLLDWLTRAAREAAGKKK